MKGNAPLPRSAFVTRPSNTRASGPATLNPAIASVTLSHRVPCRQRHGVKEPLVIALRHPRADHEVITLAQTSDREIPRDPAPLADQRRQTRPPRHDRHPVRQQPVQPVPRPRPGDAVSGKVRDIDDPRPLAQHERLTPHRPPPVLPLKPHGFLARLALGGKPQGMLPAIVQPEHRPHRPLRLIHRPHPHRPARAAFLIRKVDLEAVGILVTHPRLGESACPPRRRTAPDPSRTCPASAHPR